MANINEIWAFIDEWLSKNAPSIQKDLNPGATEADFKELEDTLKIKLTDDFKECYRIHNGQSRESLIGEWILLSTTNILKQYSILKPLLDDGTFKKGSATAQGSVKPDWWNEKWIPIASNGGGDFYCLDLDPPKDGKIGQLIVYWHADDKRKIIAGSLSELLSTFVDDLKNDQYTVDEWLGLQKK